VASRAGLDINDGDLRRHSKFWDAAVGRVQSLGQATGRIAAQKGGVKAGGGRGVFAGTLRDFGTRDEFVGRTGTIGRGLKAGRIGGALLAFISVEEALRGISDLLSGSKNFGEVVKSTLSRLLPSILRESIPRIIDEFRGLTTQQKLSVKNQLDRKLANVIEESNFSNDTELNRRLFRWAAHRFHNSDDYGRMFQESVDWRR